MSEVIFLKTSAFGGYEKKDVDERLKSLYMRISELESELRETKSILEKYQNGTEQEKIYESVLADERAKIAELQAQNNLMSENLEAFKSENEQLQEEVSVLQEEVSDLEQEISEANTTIASLNASDDVTAMSIVFAEAKKSAEMILAKAKSEAADLEENSKKLAEDIISDADNKAAEIVFEAQKYESEKIAETDEKSKQMEVASENMKALMLGDVNKLNETFLKLKQIFGEFQKTGGDILDKSEKMLEETKNTLQEGGVPVFHAPENSKSVFSGETIYENYEFDDSGFSLSELDSVNIVGDNFMDDLEDNLENDLKEFASGGTNSSEKESISLADIAKQAESLNNDENNNNKNNISLDEIAKQAEAINDENNNNKNKPMSLEEIAKQAEAIS